VESSLDLGTESRRLVEDRATKRTLVEACQVRVDALAGLEARVAAAEARQGHAALAATEARRTAQARAAAIVAIDTARTERDRLATAAVEDGQRSEAAGARVTEADAALAAARSERDHARSCVDAAQARLTRERDAAELVALEERATRGRAAHTAIKTASPDAALPVTAEVLAAIREQQRAVDMSRTRLEAGRPQLRIAAYGPLDAVIDGTPTRLQSGGSVERRVDRVLRLDLPGVASIKVSAGATTDELTAELTRAEGRLAELLRNAGASDLADAERLHRRREEASRTVAEQQRILDHALHGLTPRALMERIGVLRPKVAMATSDAADGSDPVDLGQAEAALALADRTLRESEQAWQAAHEELRRIEVAGERRATEARMTADDLARREEALVAERATMPDEILQQRVVEAEGAERGASSELEASRTELALHGPDEARRALADAKRDLDAIEAETRLVQDRLLQVTTRLEEHGEDGLAEDLVEAQTRRDHAEAELRRYQTQAAARKLLFETLREERDRARRSYVGPLRREVEELGRTVFGPGFAVDLDDSLSVVSRTLDGRTIPYASLSIGAQEQVAIITRLACATIVAPDGGVPVILDDALGNSDPKRLDAMSEVLGAAGRQCQIIVLTCQPERYDHIPGATLVALA
jgi:hypothetical protein